MILAILVAFIVTAGADAESAEGCPPTGPLPSGWKRVGETEGDGGGVDAGRGLAGCPYYASQEAKVQGAGSVCPASMLVDARQVAEFVRARIAEKYRVHLVVDGLEDSVAIDPRVLRGLLRKVRGMKEDIAVIEKELRDWRARSRSACMRHALQRELPGVSVLEGIPRVNQPTGRRGTTVFAVLSREPNPTADAAAEAAAKRVGNEAPAKKGTRGPGAAPGAAVKSPLPRKKGTRLEALYPFLDSDAPTGRARPRAKLGLEISLSGVVAAENTHFWAPSSFVGGGLIADQIRLGDRDITATVRVGYAFGDTRTAVPIFAEQGEEFVQQHAVPLSIEVTPLPRLRIGIRGQFSLVRETLFPRTDNARTRLLPGVAIGPRLAYRVLGTSNTRFHADLHYDLLFVAAPRDLDVGLGRVHLIGLSVAWLPRRLWLRR